MASRLFSALIVEDQALMRHGLMLTLRQHFPGIKIFEAATGEDAFHCLRLHLINIVLLDISLPEISGVDVAQHILKNYPKVKVLIVTQYNGEAMIKNLVKSGVHSFFLKNGGVQEMKIAVNTVLSGKQYIPESLRPILLPSSDVPAIVFSKREAQILLLLKMGRSSKEISHRLQLTENTINSYREDMLQKTKTSNVAQLISYAYENGILG